MVWPPSTHQDVQDAITAMLTSPAVPTLPPQIGQWIQQPGLNFSSNNFPTGMLLLSPVWLPAGTYDAVSFYVDVVGSTGAVARALGYTNVSGAPSSLMFDTGQVSTTTTGAKTTTGLSIVSPPGGLLFWGGAVAQGSPTTVAKLGVITQAWVMQISASAPGLGVSSPVVYQQNSVTGSPPTPPSGSLVGFSSAYQLAFRRSA